MDVQDRLRTMLTTAISGAGIYKSLADLGFKVEDNSATSDSVSTTLTFDETVFRDAFAADSTSVTKFFSMSSLTNGKLTQNGFAAAMTKIMTSLADPVDGELSQANTTINNQITDWNKRISDMNDAMDSKKTRLQQQYATLEATLAQMQSQQSALTSLSAKKTS
jgi:flagellar capping protein FliD